MGAIGGFREEERVVKIITSATLTQDPAKLQRLELHAPRYIALMADDNR